MGTIYTVACKKCKVARDLDKLTTSRKVRDRAEALNFSVMLENRPILYREGLLLSFLAEHMGHEIVFFNENSECAGELDPDSEESENKSDGNFW